VSPITICVTTYSMFSAPHILADGSDELIKFIFGGLFVLIWIAGAITSAAKKKQKEQRRLMEQRRGVEPPGPQQSWQDIYRDLTGGAAGVPPSRPEAPPPIPREPVQRAVPPPMPQAPALKPNQGRKDRRGPRRQKAQQTPKAPTSVARPPTFSDVSPFSEVMPAVEAHVPGQAGGGLAGTGEAGISSDAQHRARGRSQAPIRLTADGLRRQFILTEVLRPPLAMREDEPR
jgi:hypothetical protein